MDTRTFVIIQALNKYSAFGIELIDDLKYFYGNDCNISIPIGYTYVAYTFDNDISSVPYSPDYRIKNGEQYISIWKLS